MWLTRTCVVDFVCSRAICNSAFVELWQARKIKVIPVTFCVLIFQHLTAKWIYVGCLLSFIAFYNTFSDTRCYLYFRRLLKTHLLCWGQRSQWLFAFWTPYKFSFTQVIIDSELWKQYVAKINAPKGWATNIWKYLQSKMDI